MPVGLVPGTKVTLNGQVIRHPDGTPVMAGDLVEGAEYFIDTETLRLVPRPPNV